MTNYTVQEEVTYTARRRAALVDLLSNKQPKEYLNGNWRGIAKTLAEVAQEAGIDVTAWDPYNDTVPDGHLQTDPEHRAFLVDTLAGRVHQGQRRSYWWQEARQIVALLRDAGADVTAQEKFFSDCEKGVY